MIEAITYCPHVSPIAPQHYLPIVARRSRMLSYIRFGDAIQPHERHAKPGQLLGHAQVESCCKVVERNEAKFQRQQASALHQDLPISFFISILNKLLDFNVS